MGVWFGRRLRQLRWHVGVSAEDLEERSGVPQALLSVIEAGKREPTDEVLEKLSSALGMGFWDLKQATYDDRFTDDEVQALSNWLADRQRRQTGWPDPEFWQSVKPDRLDDEVGRLFLALGYQEHRVSHQMRRKADWFLAKDDRFLIISILGDQALTWGQLKQFEKVEVDLTRQSKMVVTRQPVEGPMAVHGMIFNIAFVGVEDLARYGADAIRMQAEAKERFFDK